MKLYKLVCFIYSTLTFYIENFFLKKYKIKKGSLENDGIKKLKLNPNKIKLGEVQKEIKVNKYHMRSIYSHEDIFTFLENLFDKDFRDRIKNLTGFNYSIDYFGAYKNFPILASDQKNGYYANHYHYDKPYSKNFLKIFLPLDRISRSDGPLEIIKKKESAIIKEGKKNLTHANKYYFTGEKGDILLCKLNVCFHKAGIPKNGNFTHLIMLQLNPSLNWQLSKDLYKRQFKIEPKFTSIKNLFANQKKFK